MRKQHIKAFTLTELLVSMAILSGLILLLFSVVDSTTQVWNKSEQRVDSFREARAALLIIARDLQTMVPAPTPTPTINAPNPTPSYKFLFINPSRNGNSDVTFTSSAEDTFGDRLFFLSAQPGNSQVSGAKSDVCATGYYLDYTATSNSITNIPTFKLYRHFRDSNTTFANLKGYAGSPQTSTVLMQADSSNSNTDEILARNVVDFRVVAYDSDMKTTSPWNPQQIPYALDISITAYNYSIANRFDSKSDWSANSKNLAARQTFTTRVYLPRH